MMRKLASLVCGVILVLGAGRSSALESPPQPRYQLELQIYRKTAEIGNNGEPVQAKKTAKTAALTIMGSDTVRYDPNALTSDDMELIGSAELDYGDLKLVMDDETLTWDGKEKPKHKGIIPLSFPSLNLPAGIDTTVSIKEGAPVQYFQQMRDGRYRLKTLELEPGFQLQFRLTPVRGAYRLRINVNGTVLLEPASKAYGSIKWALHRPAYRKYCSQVTMNVASSGEDSGKLLDSEVASARPKRWVCLRLPVQRGGDLLVFIRLLPVGSKPGQSQSVGK